MKQKILTFLVFAGAVAWIVGGVIYLGLSTKVYGPVNFDQKMKEWNGILRVDKTTTEKGGIMWTKRTMQLVLKNGEVSDVQVGLSPEGYFVWKVPVTNDSDRMMSYQR